MKIAVNQKTNDKNAIYIFDNESFDELLELNMHCIHKDYIDEVDINTTDYNIECIKKCKITDKDWNKLPPKKDYKIGIIIPNYNYEHTIEKCLDSIFNQTYKNYEVVFVDDMSTDNSVLVARQTYEKYLYNNDHKCMKIVRLKQKRYNGGARNEGYLHLSDDVDYIFCVDSDDWLYDEYALEKINNKLQGEPDVVFGGLASYRNGIINKECKIPEYKDKYEAFDGWSGVGKIIKKSLATRQECLYNEGTLKEDKNQHCKICIYMNSFKLLKEPIYMWNQSNNKSVTTIRTANPLWYTSTIRHYADTLQLYLTVKGMDPIIDEMLKERVTKTKNEVNSGGDKQW